jgi:hypothetical protein
MEKKTTEKRLERKLAREVEKRGGKALKFASPYYTGMPDRLILLPDGVAAWAELKSPGGKLRPLQADRILLLRRLGFLAEVIDDEDSLAAVLAALDRLAQ